MDKNIELPEGMQNKIVTEVLRDEMKFNLVERDERGLIKGLEYKYTPENFIDWRSMIPVEYLYINSDQRRRVGIEKKYGKPFNEIDIVNDKVQEVDLVSTLAASKYLLKIRGYDFLEETVKEAGDSYAAVTCTIGFIGNFEVQMREIQFSCSASATLNNTTSFYQRYLIEAASNRAFVRCLRSFLQIAIVSREELGADNQTEQEPETKTNDKYEILQRKMDQKGLSFENVKARLIREKVENAENFTKIQDIPIANVFNLVEKLNLYKPEAGE